MYMSFLSHVGCVIFILYVRMEKIACRLDDIHESFPQYALMYDT